MHINLILFPFVIILGTLLSINDNKRNRGVYIILCCTVFLVIGSFSSPEWLTYRYRIDTAVYKMLFEKFGDLSWHECWELAVRRYGSGGDDDIGFVVLVKLINIVTKDFYIYSVLTELIFFIPFGILLYRFSSNMLQLIFAFVFYIALIQVFILGTARQMYAIGLDMIALLAVIDRKKWWAILFFLLGVTIHFSSFLFMIPLLMVWFDVKPGMLKLAHILGFILFPFVFVFSSQVIVFMGETAGVEKYANYGMGDIAGGASVFIFLIEIMSLFCLCAIKKTDLQSHHSLRVCYTMVPFFTLLAPLLRSDGAMIRVSLYYHIFLTLLVPYALDCLFKEKDKRVVYIVAIGAFVALAGKGMEYYFFWQYQ